MSFSDPLSGRRAVLGLIAALALAGCGFQPVYAPGSQATAMRGRIETREPLDRDSFAFVGRIEDRLGRPEAPLWRLDYQIATQRADLAVTTEGSILRYNISGQAAWSLTEIATGAVVARGQAQSFTGSAATRATLAAAAAEEDARGRLMTILADQVVTELLARTGASLP